MPLTMQHQRTSENLLSGMHLPPLIRINQVRHGFDFRFALIPAQHPPLSDTLTYCRIKRTALSPDCQKDSPQNPWAYWPGRGIWGPGSVVANLLRRNYGRTRKNLRLLDSIDLRNLSTELICSEQIYSRSPIHILPPHSFITPIMRGCGIAERTSLVAL